MNEKKYWERAEKEDEVNLPERQYAGGGGEGGGGLGGGGLGGGGDGGGGGG